MCKFCHLHVHSDASKDGCGKVENLVRYASELGMTKLALTDHGTLSGWIRFALSCQENNIQPIAGLEGYIEVDGKRGHITVLSDGDKGFNSLVQLHNTAHLRSESYKDMATFTPDELIKYNEGLILLTGCVASPLHSMSLTEAVSLGNRFKSVFNDRMFAEIMHVSESSDIWLRSIYLSEQLNIPLVATNDVHLHRKEDAPLHAMIQQMRMGMKDPYHSKELYLKSYEEMVERGNRLGIKDFQNACDRTMLIADKIIVPTITRPQKLPHVKDAELILETQAREGLKRLGLDTNLEYIERLNYELAIMKEKKFCDYFIVLNDIVQFANRNSIKYKVRGSGNGSLLLYVLGISEVDPVVYKLQFERFLNPARKKMPDVDIDVDSSGRDFVLKYASDKYGSYPIINDIRFTPKTLTHKLASQFLYSREIENAASESVDSPEFKKLESDYPLFKRAIEVMDDQTYTVGKHAAGIIIPPEDYPLPLIRNNAGEMAACYQESSNGAEFLSAAGFIKNDILGVEALTPIDVLEKRYHMRAPLPDKTSDDDKRLMLEALQKKMVYGLFEFTSAGGNELLNMCIKDATIDNLFERMVTATCINRPAVPQDLKNQFGSLLKTPRKVHPLIDPYIESTGGVMITQEQMMYVYGFVTGGGASDADLARREITKIKGLNLAEKKNVEYVSNLPSIKPLKEKFITNGQAIHGIDINTLESLWMEIASSAGYGFNRAHAVGYMCLAWEQLWWFIKKPLAFYAELCNVKIDDTDAVYEYLFQIAGLGYTIKPPNINLSSDLYTYDEENIYVPLSQIKGLSNGATTIVNERNLNGEFKSYEDFNSRISGRACNNGIKKKLEELGSFTGLTGSFDDFKIKDDKFKPSITKQSQAQMEHLKFILPSKQLIEKMKRLKLGWKGGIVTEIEIKNKGHGDYAVIRFIPNDNLCVCRPIPENVKVGDILFYLGDSLNKKFRRFDSD